MPRNNRGHGPGRIVEKPKDFKNAIKRLLKELTNQKKLLIISCLLAMLGSIISIIAPNRLSKLTDEITKGLVINQKSMTKLTKKITNNINQKNIEKVITETITINLNEEKIREIYTTNEISEENKLKFKEIIENKEEILYKLKELPDIVLEKIFTNSKYNNINVSSKDKITLIKSLNKNITKIQLTETYQNIIFKEITLNKIKINSKEQYKYLKIISTLKKDDKPNKIQLHTTNNHGHNF